MTYLFDMGYGEYGLGYLYDEYPYPPSDFDVNNYNPN